MTGVNLYSYSTLNQRPGETVKPFLRYLNLTKPKNQKKSWETHMPVHEQPIIHRLFNSSDGFTIKYKKSAQTVKPFLIYCNLKNRAIWLVDTVLNHNWRTGCDFNMRFSPKWALYNPLTWQKKSGWNCAPNLGKSTKKLHFYHFWHFFQNLRFWP